MSLIQHSRVAREHRSVGSVLAYSTLWDCMEFFVVYIHSDTAAQTTTYIVMYLSKATRCCTSNTSKLYVLLLLPCKWLLHHKHRQRGQLNLFLWQSFNMKKATTTKNKEKLPKVIIVIWFTFWSLVHIDLQLSLHATVVVPTSEDKWKFLISVLLYATVYLHVLEHHWGQEVENLVKKNPQKTLFLNKTFILCKRDLRPHSSVILGFAKW